MEQAEATSAKPTQLRGRQLVENFGNIALLGLIYLCVNIIYQEGYLFGLGIEFGFFSLAKSMPIFDNFLVAAYAFTIWGVVSGVSLSTYDQFFGLFTPTSWRDKDVFLLRFWGFMIVFLFYVSLHLFYIFSQGNIFDIRNIGVTKFVLRLLWPSWGLITWGGSLVSLSLIMLLFGLSNQRYRKARKEGPSQFIGFNRKLIFVQMNLISPIWAILSAVLFFVIVPGWYGKEMADITINNIYRDQKQVVQFIEIENSGVFCGEKTMDKGSFKKWEKKDANTFTIHFLGHFADLTLFIKIFGNSGKPLYNTCFVSPNQIISIQLSSN